jgi:hypothetical protein
MPMMPSIEAWSDIKEQSLAQLMIMQWDGEANRPT